MGFRNFRKLTAEFLLWYSWFPFKMGLLEILSFQNFHDRPADIGQPLTTGKQSGLNTDYSYFLYTSIKQTARCLKYRQLTSSQRVLNLILWENDCFSRVSKSTEFIFFHRLNKFLREFNCSLCKPIWRSWQASPRERKLNKGPFMWDYALLDHWYLGKKAWFSPPEMMFFYLVSWKQFSR